MFTLKAVVSEIEMEKMVSGALGDCSSDSRSFYMSFSYKYHENMCAFFNNVTLYV